MSTVERMPLASLSFAELRCCKCIGGYIADVYRFGEPGSGKLTGKKNFVAGSGGGQLNPSASQLINQSTDQQACDVQMTVSWKKPTVP